MQKKLPAPMQLDALAAALQPTMHAQQLMPYGPNPRPNPTSMQGPRAIAPKPMQQAAMAAAAKPMPKGGRSLVGTGPSSRDPKGQGKLAQWFKRGM